MQLSVIGLAITLAIVWGGLTLVIGLINVAAPSYGADYLRLLSSFHPGISVSGTLGDALVAAAAAIIDGALAGVLVGGVYNWVAGLVAPEPKFVGPPLKKGI